VLPYETIYVCQAHHFYSLYTKPKLPFSLSTEEYFKDLMIHIKMDEAINDGKFNAWFVLTDNDFEESYHHFIDMIEGEIDLEDEDLMNIQIALAINSGDLINTLVENFRNQDGDWETTFEDYFEAINMGDVDLENLDSYTAATIYKAVYNAEELRCEQAMIAQFGLLEAAYRGYIQPVDYFFTDENGDYNANAYAGVSMAALVVVAIASVGARKVGSRSSGSDDKKAPLIPEFNNYQKQIEKMDHNEQQIPPRTESQDAIELCWQPVRVIRNITFQHGSAV